MSPFHLVVNPQRVLVRYRHGVLVDVLPAGRHRVVRRAQTTEVDLRERLLLLAPQEIPTADDGVSVRVSAAVRWCVVDAVAFVERSTDPVAAVYLATQVALRDALAGLSCADLTGRGATIPIGAVTAAVDLVASGVGIGVAEVVVKDVILPGEMRSAALAVVTARQRGLAQLEAARAETAALRSLANGAMVLEKHPALARLRLVQAAPLGSQIVLRLGAVDDSRPDLG